MDKRGTRVETYWEQVRALLNNEQDMPETCSTPEPKDAPQAPLAVPGSATDSANETGGYLLKSFDDCLAVYKSVRYRDWHPFPGEWGIFLNQPAISNHAAGECAAMEDLLSEYLQAHFRFDLYAMQAEALGRKPLYRQGALRFPPHRALTDVRATYDATRWAEANGAREMARKFFSTRQMHIIDATQLPALNSYIATVLLEGANGLFQVPPGLRNDQQYWPDCLPNELADDCPRHTVNQGTYPTPGPGIQTTRVAPCSIIPRKVEPQDWTSAMDGNHYLFGAAVTSLTGLPAFEKLAKENGNPVDTGPRHISFAFSGLTSLKDIHKFVKTCGYFDMRNTAIHSHILGLMLIDIVGLITTSLGQEVDDILNKWKNQGRKGVVSCQLDLIKAGFEELAQL